MTVGVLLSLLACTLPLSAPRNCEQRSMWFPDDDGDGLADGDRVFVGCEAPGPGWVQTPRYPSDTAVADTAVADTAVADTAVADTALTDTSAPLETAHTGDTAPRDPTGVTADTGSVQPTADTGAAHTGSPTP